MYDVLLECDVLVIALVYCILCDNDRASELVNHLGSRATRFCQICIVSVFISITHKFIMFHTD